MKSKFTWFLALILTLMLNVSFAQEKTITGVVSNAGLPLPGASVTVKGTTVGTSTDLDGKYSLKAPVGATIEFSFLSMKTKSIVVGASNVINVSLEEDVNKLTEVVITNSYNAGQKRSDVVSSVSTVSAKQLENNAFTSFDQMLQGQVAGLTVVSGSGQPGSAAKVRIRGNSSITGNNDPLYILDGVPITANDYAALNPNDFENVNVLKDAAATAIYGSRSSAGVIVITSKKGKYNSPTQYTYRGQSGITEVSRARFNMMNSSQLLNFQRLVSNGRGATGGANGGPMTDAEIAEASKVNTNWRDVFFRTGFTQSHELQIRGGSENTRFFNSLGYFEQDGVAIRSNLQRFTFRSNLDHKADENTTMGSTLSIGFTKQDLIDSENSITLQNPYAAAYLGSPYDSLYDANGDFATGNGFIGANAYENLVRNLRYNNQLKLVGSLYAERKFAKNFTARFDLGIDYSYDQLIRGSDPNSFYGSTTQPGNEGFYGETNSYIARFNNTFKLNYSNTFAEKHSVDISGYFEWLKTHARSGQFFGYGINPKLVGYPEGITQGSAANGLFAEVGGAESESGILSYFMVGKYGYGERFNAELSLRRDASNRFADANKWATFYAVGLNYNFINENLDGSDKLFQSLIVRASYGSSGNQNGIGNFQEEGTWGTGGYGGNPGIAPLTFGNPALKWESGVKRNIGVDYSLLKNRLFGTVEYYDNYTDNLFISQTPPFESGKPQFDENAGKMSNKGVDIQLEGILVKTNDLSFSLYGNFNYNKNTIEDLGQVSEFVQGTAIIREGLPFGSHFAVGWAGVNPANGQPLYYDLNGNVTTQFTEDNSTANWGTYEPPYSGGFGHKLNYKGLEFSSLFTFAADYMRYNNQTFFQENPNFAQFNMSTLMLTMWQNPGDITEVQSFRYNREFSSKDIEDASFLRLRNITIAYNLPDKAIKSLKYISSVRIYAQGQNLATWTKFSGFDPEDDNNIAGYEYPTPRIYTFGVDVKF
ncbi:SusC/RagA family TonB-linked outer membrane protein [Flavobacterium aurantiibacter]|uniref:TonB-dependent receptor plug domain-containing protein n=1 Tax=Flavobacterium aurantiibacter TaxID=2023067 RepID=A0A255ZNU9_9FLAO|nr:SusC/RagA family TonB-linked outer membrane protein [Flavobacterium aurantiibacter]OYQ43183.1 hypothetical protein CHX27_10635 [Flavobacterium aurantiibacter]